MAFEDFWFSKKATVAAGSSLRFTASSNLRLSRTPAVAGNLRTWTWSCWVKRGLLGSSVFSPTYLSADIDGVSSEIAGFRGSNSLGGPVIDAAGGLWNNSSPYGSSAVYRDPGAWYHHVIQFDTTQALNSNRFKLFVNGVQVSLGTVPNLGLNQQYAINSNRPQAIGNAATTLAAYGFDGYMFDPFMVDGLIVPPTTFGYFDTNNVWVPYSFNSAKANVIAAGGFGTNGFALNFDSANFTSGPNTWADQSGNGNNFTANWDCAAGAYSYTGSDITSDSPTVNSAHIYNMVTAGVPTLPNTFLTPWWWGYNSSTWNNQLPETITIPTSGKWWVEYLGYTGGAVASNALTGFVPVTSARTTTINIGPGFSVGYGWNNPIGAGNSAWYDNGVSSSIGPTLPCAPGVVQTIKLGFAIDCDQATPQVELWQNAVNSVTDTAGWQLMATKTLSRSDVNSGLVPSFGPNYMNQGPSPLYTNLTVQAAGYKQLNATNLPTTPIPNGTTGFQALLDTGANILTTAQAAVPSGLWWVKDRVNANEHQLLDSVRGTANAFDCPAFAGSNVAPPEYPYVAPLGNSVAWCWAAGASGVANTDGTIPSTVYVNSQTGFSIVNYTGNGSQTATVGHGLGAKPDFLILKAGTSGVYYYVQDFWVAQASVAGSLLLGQTMSLFTGTGVEGRLANASSFTSTVFSFAAGSGASPYNNVGNVNISGGNYYAYCWRTVPGYSSFGSYTGNGSADGPFVYTGMKPAFVLIKSSSTTGNWEIYDNARNTYNPETLALQSNLTSAESTINGIDFVSNGFKIRTTDANLNTSGQTYIYAAFAQNPFGGSNVAPVTAR